MYLTSPIPEHLPRHKPGTLIRKISAEQAQAEGFIVDTCCYPHYGYMDGYRFISSVEYVHVYTDLEWALLVRLKAEALTPTERAIVKEAMLVAKCHLWKTHRALIERLKQVLRNHPTKTNLKEAAND